MTGDPEHPSNPPARRRRATGMHLAGWQGVAEFLMTIVAVAITSFDLGQWVATR
jgi:hypothetical protein